MIKKEVTDYKEFGKVLRISDDITEVLVTLDFGPRIIKYSYINGENIMNDTAHAVSSFKGKDFDDYYYKGAEFNIYGGHRLWVSPESKPETYYPDNDRVNYTLTENGAIFTPKAQKENGLALTLEVYYCDDNIKVVHHVKNISTNIKTIAAWGLTVAALNGIEIIPFNNNDTGLLHNRQISIWPYTDLRDERIYFGHKYATITQKNIDKPLKLGFNLNAGIVYYIVGKTTYIKEFNPNINGLYPDNNVCFETYSCKDFTEIETLSELKELKPNESIVHTEKWSLKNTPCEFNEKDDDSISKFINKL